MKPRLLEALLIGGCLLAIAGGVIAVRHVSDGPAPAGTLPHVTEFRDGHALPSFRLEGPRGAFTEAALQGQWSFVFFGFTQCPDICPTALDLMRDVKARVNEKLGAGGTAPFQVVFVSVDPARDTRELLDQYMAAFDPAFIALRGDAAALLPLQKDLGVFYQRNDATDKQHYTVDHSAGIYLIDPQGRLAAVFSPPQEAAKVAGAFLRIRQRG